MVAKKYEKYWILRPTIKRYCLFHNLQIILQVERIKIDEMRLPEKITFILPPCNASTMKVVTRLLNNSLAGETLLETEQLKVQLSMVSNTSRFSFMYVDTKNTTLLTMYRKYDV